MGKIVPPSHFFQQDDVDKQDAPKRAGNWLASVILGSHQHLSTFDIERLKDQVDGIPKEISVGSLMRDEIQEIFQRSRRQ